ncbi:MAG: Gx transporter family protein [Pseudobutyrivibrio sp.]|nr:Gx transporter family protein [Pseudobutyrivibrio sp.]
MKTNKIAMMGLLTALAFVFSYIEFLLPINIGVPGAKIGLANLVIVVAIYIIGERNAFVLSCIRVILVSLTFGNMAMMLYSLAGAMLSFLVMILAKKSNKLSATGVSVLGGVFHNVGQIIVAMFMLDTAYILYYLPFLMIIGTISGIVIGLLASAIISRLKKLRIN